MKDKQRIKILLKIIERFYCKNPGMQTLIDESRIDICRRATRGGGRGRHPLSFFKNKKKCPDFRKKDPDCVHLMLNLLFKI